MHRGASYCARLLAPRAIATVLWVAACSSGGGTEQEAPADAVFDPHRPEADAESEPDAPHDTTETDGSETDAELDHRPADVDATSGPPGARLVLTAGGGVRRSAHFELRLGVTAAGPVGVRRSGRHLLVLGPHRHRP